MVPIYFDHKIADNVSFLQKFVYFGILPHFDETPTKIFPLIPKCEKNNINVFDDLMVENIDLFKEYLIDIADLVEVDKTCPKTYYKNKSYKEHVYKYNSFILNDYIENKSIDSITTLSQLIYHIDSLPQTQQGGMVIIIVNI